MHLSAADALQKLDAIDLEEKAESPRASPSSP
jgi:hypothetical protein